MDIIENYLYEVQGIQVTKVGGGVVIRKDENNNTQVLLIQRAKNDHYPDVWEFPRGRCTEGEDLIKCVEREVKEETGLDVIVGQLLEQFKYFRKDDKNKIYSVQYNLLCNLKNPNQEIKLSKEHQAYKWISSFGEAELLLSPELKKTISLVFDDDKQQVIYPKRLFQSELIDEE